MAIDVFNEVETLTLEQVAEQLGVCQLTVRRWHKQGLHAIKCGGRTVTNMTAVNEFLNAKKPPVNKEVAATVDDIKNLIR